MKHNYFLIALSILLILFTGCKKKSDSSSDNPSQKYISGDIWFNSGLNTLCQTSDNGFAIAALVGIHKIYVAKTTSSFDIQWSKTFAANIADVGGIVESTDKGFVIVSNFTDTTIHPNKKYVDLIKLNPSGNLLWEKKYAFRYQYRTGFALRETPDKGFIITTVHDKIDNLGFNFIELFKVNSNGDSLWSHDYSDHYSTSGHDIQVTSDNGFIAVGDQIVLKTDSLGNKQWDQYFAPVTFTNVRILPDGSYIVLGMKDVSTFTSSNGLDYILMKFDPSGTKLWEKLYNVGDHESSANLCLTPEGGFIFSGMTDVNSPYEDEVVIIKTDGAGNELSVKTLSLGRSPEAWGLVYQNGSYVFYGGTTLSTGLDYYLLLMRFNM
jgi:hypothetical protein